jgi:hypothetical protein
MLVMNSNFKKYFKDTKGFFFFFLVYLQLNFFQIYYLLSSEIQVMWSLVLVMKTIIVYYLDRMNENLNVSFGKLLKYAVVFLMKLYLQLIHNFLERLKSCKKCKYHVKFNISLPKKNK